MLTRSVEWLSITVYPVCTTGACFTGGVFVLENIRNQEIKTRIIEKCRQRKEPAAWLKEENRTQLSVWPHSSLPLIYCWLTCCADLYLHYLPSFYHKPQIYDFSECHGPKSLVSFFSLSSCPSLTHFLFFKGFHSPPQHHPSSSAGLVFNRGEGQSR